MVAFAGSEWDGKLLDPTRTFVTGIGAGTTYPDYKPAPFIVSAEHEGVDTVTVVTEGIFSYCGVKVKIDTDRHLGPETAPVRANGEQVGHVTTAEYGSQMLSIGGVRHLTGGSKKEGNVTCETLLELCAGAPVTLAHRRRRTRWSSQAGRPPIVDGRPRSACASAAVRPRSASSRRQWLGHVDEVIVVDDHITGVLTEHQAGRVLDMPPAGIRVRGRRSTPGRYFQVANPGLGWGGTDITDPLAIIQRIDPKVAWPGLRLLITSTTGEDAALLRARREAAAGAGRDAGGRAPRGRPHRRELRAVAMHRPVHGRRRRLAARRRDREPGAADPLGGGRRDPRHHGRRAGLRLAGRRHHRDGRRDAHAGAGSFGYVPTPALVAPDRVHPAAPPSTSGSAGMSAMPYPSPSIPTLSRPTRASRRGATTTLGHSSLGLSSPAPERSDDLGHSKA